MENWHNMLALSIVFTICFLVWNNFPQLVELVGQFLVAHARSIRMRKEIFNELAGKQEVSK